MRINFDSWKFILLYLNCSLDLYSTEKCNWQIKFYSVYTNTFGKGMNPHLSLAMSSRIYWLVSSLGEGKLNSN